MGNSEFNSAHGEPKPKKVEPKPDWKAVPKGLLEAIEQVLNQKIESAEIVWGGYGPSATFKLEQ